MGMGSIRDSAEGGSARTGRTAGHRVALAIARLATPTRVRVYPALTLLVLICVDIVDAVWGLGPSSTQRLWGGDFLGFYAAGALIRSAPTALNDPLAQQLFQQRLLGHQFDQVAVWVSPPYFAWAFAPLSVLPYKLAFACFVALSLSCLAISFKRLQRELGSSASVGGWMWLGIQYYPMLQWLLNGQITALWLSVFIQSFVALRRGRDVEAGLWFGLLACKPTLGLGFGVVLLVARRWRALAAASFVGAALLGFAWLTMPAVLHGYFHGSAALLALVRGKGYPTAGLHGSFEFGTLLFDDLSHRLASLAGVAVALAMLAFIAHSWWRKPWQPGARAWDLRLAASLAIGVVASPHLFVYDLMLLLLPLFILLRYFPTRDGVPLGGGTLLGLAALTWALGLVGPALTVGQQELTQLLFGVSVALQLGVLAVCWLSAEIAREAEWPSDESSAR